MAKKRAIAVYSKERQDRNILYATGMVEDEIAYIEIDGKSHLLVDSFLVEMAKRQAKVDEVVDKGWYYAHGACHDEDILAMFLNEQKVKKISMPYSSPAGMIDFLRKKGFKVALAEEPFFPGRRNKSEAEIKCIEEVQRANERAMEMAILMIRHSQIGDDGLLYASAGGQLTSESVRQAIDIVLLEHRCISGGEAIVACGDDAVELHNTGRGTLKANLPIVIDIFPYSRLTGYYADMSRTVVRGRASPKLKEMHEAVKLAQQLAISEVCDGIDAAALDERVMDFFEARGFNTNFTQGMDYGGFLHGLGHGVGLDVHEEPFSNKIGRLREGDVFTIEPGLYYRGIGGVRLEDMVVVKKDGCMNLTRFPHFLEI